jgi:hypothetical protein
MNLLQSTFDFINLVEHFYQVHDTGNKVNLLALECIRKELKVIEECADCEHPRRIISIRRMLTNTLPHMGYEERTQMDAELNFILDICRERLRIAQN